MSNPIDLLILSSQANEAEGLITQLRNRGLPVRGFYTHHPERLAELAAKHPCDLILCCVYDPQIDLQATMSHHQRLGLDMPLLLIDEADADPEPLFQALRSGARDLIARHDPERLQIAVTREFGDLQQRRALAVAREQLERCEQRTRDLVEASTEPFAFVQQGLHVLANPMYRKIFGFVRDEELEGIPLLDLVAPEQRGEARAFLRAHETDTDLPAVGPMYLACLHTDGRRFDAEMRAAPAEVDGERCLRLTVKLRPEPGSMAAAAQIDPDTGLPCRVALMDAISRRVSVADGAHLALIYLGLQGLDRIAQRDGLTTAFEVSASIARSLPNHIPEGGYLAQVGNDAFAILAEVQGPGDARAIADDLGQKVRLLLESLGVNPSPCCALGVALTGQQGSSATDLLNRAWADANPQSARHLPAHRPQGFPYEPAVQAKRPAPGPAPHATHYPQPSQPPHPTLNPTPDRAVPPERPRVPPPHPSNRVVAPTVANPHPRQRPRPPATPRGPSPPLTDQALMAALVNEALDESGAAELRLVFQPIISLMGEDQENHSVLLRLLDADEHLHEAKEFIGAANATGRMGDIDRWVITHAIAELANQRAMGHRLNFFINIGEASLRDDDLLIWICDTLRDQGARGSWLTFQFPEDEARRNLPALVRLVEGLKKIKCRVALTRCGQLDDPQSLMQRLPLDFLLFAHNFARGLAEDKVKQQQLIAFASLAHEFNVKSIVTGVEDARALTVLWTAGVDFVQGNFLQAPSPALQLQG